MKILELKQDDKICALEINRKTLFPIFSVLNIDKIGKPFTGQFGEGYTQLIKMRLSDQDGAIEIMLPADAEEGIYDRVYYTPNVQLVVQELTLRKKQSQSIINSVKKHEAVITEVDSILSQMNINPEPEEQHRPNIQELIRKELEPFVSQQQEMTKTLQSIIEKQTKEKEPLKSGK